MINGNNREVFSICCLGCQPKPHLEPQLPYTQDTAKSQRSSGGYARSALGCLTSPKQVSRQMALKNTYPSDASTN